MSWAQRDILKQPQKWRPKGLAREPCDDDGDDDGDDDEQRENAAPSVRAASHADYTPCATPPHHTLRTLYILHGSISQNSTKYISCANPPHKINQTYQPKFQLFFSV